MKTHAAGKCQGQSVTDGCVEALTEGAGDQRVLC